MAIRRKSDRINPRCVSPEGEELKPGRGIPNNRRAIRAGGQDARPVRRERYGKDVMPVPLQDEEQSSGGSVAHLRHGARGQDDTPTVR